MNMDYRREIDGLRALAVVPVICFHAGFQLFGGGFVGVDVFFVISGYLITSILLHEQQADIFSLANFYERRARRILPALLFVMAACIPFAWHLMIMPSDLDGFSHSLAAVAVFASNILFWRTSGYFDTAAELKPLLHTWSLAVEEQFYLLFPIFLMLTRPLGRRWTIGLLVGIAMVSLSLAHWGAFNRPAAAFYLLPTRGWELLLGSFAAFYVTRTNRTGHSQFASIAGLILIAYAIFAFSKATPFPSAYALIPATGTVLILLFASPRTLVGSVLGHKLFVGVGLISYSAYLWHQPLFAFARHKRLNEGLPEPDTYAMLALALVAIILAYLSWRFVEQPFRRKGTIGRTTVIALAVSCSAFFITIGLGGLCIDGCRDKLPPNVVWESLGNKLANKGDICDPRPVADYVGINACEFGDKNSQRVMILYGDSHAQAISEALNERLTKSNIKGIRVELDGCAVVPRIHDARNTGSGNNCDEKFSNFLSYATTTASEIIVLSRWTFRLFPTPGEIEELAFVNSDGGREVETHREYVAIVPGSVPSYSAPDKVAAVRHFIAGLLTSRIKVYFIYPIPEIGWDIARLNVNHYVKTGVVLDQISINHQDFIKRNKFVHGIFAEFEAAANFVPIKPESVFCNTFIAGRCAAQFETVPFYYDDDHLSDIGAKYVVDLIFRSGNDK